MMYYRGDDSTYYDYRRGFIVSDGYNNCPTVEYSNLYHHLSTAHLLLSNLSKIMNEKLPIEKHKHQENLKFINLKQYSKLSIELISRYYHDEFKLSLAMPFDFNSNFDHLCRSYEMGILKHHVENNSNLVYDNQEFVDRIPTVKQYESRLTRLYRKIEPEQDHYWN